RRPTVPRRQCWHAVSTLRFLAPPPEGEGRVGVYGVGDFSIAPEPLTPPSPHGRGSLQAGNVDTASRMKRSVALDAKGDAHAAADAQGREALLRVALLHFVDERGENPRARGADRVADGDRSAVDVDPVALPAELLADRQRLGGEGFVGLDQVEIADRPA